MTTQEAKAIADTILAQLGGSRFIVMTGSKNFMHDAEGALSFHYPKRKGFKVSAVKIRLNAMDTYDVTFTDMRRNMTTETKEVPGVYFDQLQAVFTAETGLVTRL